MLLQFSVENYKSIKDRIVLSMEASKDDSHLDNFVQEGKERILKSAAIFGANASGKSNIFHALTAAILIIRKSNDSQVGDPLALIFPFQFDGDTVSKPTLFEFVFVTEGKKYVYGFSATREQIKTEYLYIYNSAKPTTIFERDEDGLETEDGTRINEKYRFTVPSIKSKLKPIIERNTNNKLFLATATAWNCEDTKIPMMWFMNTINTYSPTQYTDMLPKTGAMFENDNDESLRHFVNGILKEADINIDDYLIEPQETPGQLVPVALPNGVAAIQERKIKTYQITTFHNITDDNGNVGRYQLDMHQESLGTKNLFFLSPIIKHAFETGETVCVDEFDTNLHPMLVIYLVGLFNNPTVNKNNAQLIISSHAMTLLDLTVLRRDQIYFIEKNQSNGVSELYSLDEYSPRKSEDIRKAYLLGRYGAIPIIGEGSEL